MNKSLIQQPLILTAVGVVVVIAAASALYYKQATSIPTLPGTSTATSSSDSLTAAGIVTPAQNPNLAFGSGGRVVSVGVKVGDSVSAGEVLASLDVAGLSAQRAQAQANVAAAQAHLAELIRGAREEDIAAKQTAVDQANASLTNTYTTSLTTTEQAYDKAFGGLSQYTDSLFNSPNTTNPTLVFPTVDSQLGLTAQLDRVQAQSELIVWQGEIAALGTTGSQVQTQDAIAKGLKHLQVVRAYTDALVAALGSVVPTTTFPASSIASAQTSVGTYRDTINTLITSLQSAQQSITNATLSLRSAQDALNQLTASATPETLDAARATVAAAEASVANTDAQIRNALIVSPFAGVVTSVQIKSGDMVVPNTTAVTLTPKSALQVSVYFSEIDIAKIHTGDAATITLDANPGHTYTATVASVDKAPSTNPQGGTGYKVTLQFAQSDPSIAPGMSANSIIPLSH